jgi:hypothetical protein
MPTTLAFAPCPEDLTDIFLEAPVLYQSPEPPAPAPKVEDPPPEPPATKE